MLIQIEQFGQQNISYPTKTDNHFVLSADTLFNFHVFCDYGSPWEPLGYRYVAGGHACLTNVALKWLL